MTRTGETVGISACLCAKCCRYDGGASPNDEMINIYNEGGAVLFCPETFAGLETPRPPAEIQTGGGAFDGGDVLDGRARVLSRDGRDVTGAFILGAQKTIAYLKLKGVSTVYLKAKSPSCGAGRIYDGSFSGGLINGFGVTAALLKREGFKTIEI